MSREPRVGIGLGLCLDSDSFSDSSGCMSQFVLFLFFLFHSVVVPSLLSLLLLLHVFQIEFTNFWPGLAYCCAANKVFVYSLLISWYIIILAFFLPRLLPDCLFIVAVAVARPFSVGLFNKLNADFLFCNFASTLRQLLHYHSCHGLSLPFIVLCTR